MAVPVAVLVQPHGAVIVTDRSGQVVAVSDHAGPLLGRPAGALLGARLTDGVAPGDQPEVRLALDAEQPEARSPFVLTLRNRGWETTARRVDDLVVLELEPQADPGRWPLGVMLREHQRMLHALRGCTTLEALTAVAAESLAALVGFADVAVHGGEGGAPDLRVRAVADAARAPVALLAVDAAHAGALERLGPALALAAPAHAELVRLREDGVAARLTVTVVLDDQVVAVVEARDPAARLVPPSVRLRCELLADVLALRWADLRESERRRTLSAAERGDGLAQYAVDLERAQQELTRENADLERSNRDLEQFAYAASHDLQSPLRTVRGFTDLLVEHLEQQGVVLDERAQHYRELIHDGVEHMQALVDALLAFARVERRGAPLAPVALDAVCDHVLRELAPELTEVGARIERGPLPEVIGDAAQLELVLHNLIGNAIKYRRPATSPTIEVTADRHDGEWVVSVRDDGIGFEPRFAEEVFGMFRRLHTRGEYPGTGMGLALVRRVVERHGGRVWAESAPDAGTTISLTLRPAPDPG